MADIALARNLTGTRVRIDFDEQMLDNAALRNPASYALSSATPGSAQPVVQSVILPVAQPTPLFVTLVTTEHTDGASYIAQLLGGGVGPDDFQSAGGTPASSGPSPYAGVGTPPEVELALATSKTTVAVRFTEIMEDNATIREPLNYTWTGGIETVSVQSVAGDTVILVTTEQVPGVLYVLTVAGSVRDLLDVADQLIAETDYARSADDTVVVADQASIETSTAHTDGVAVADQVAAEMEFGRVVTDTAPVDDQVVVEIDLATGPSDAVAVADQLVAETDYVRSADDAVVVTDGVTEEFIAGGGAEAPLIVACGNPSLVETSLNGTDWTTRTPVGTTNLQDVQWVPELELFIMIGIGDNDIQTSPDGINWTSRLTGVVGFAAGVWSPDLGLFVAAGSAIDLYTSINGTSWISRTTTQNGNNGAAWSPAEGIFVLVGLLTQTSDNGTSWTQRTKATSEAMAGIAWSPSLALFVAVGGNGEVETSEDGITWAAEAMAGTAQMLDVVWNPDDELFVAVGNDNTIETSPDGVNWTDRTPAQAESFKHVNWVPSLSLYVVVGGDGAIETSPDGITWTDRSIGGTPDFSGVY